MEDIFNKKFNKLVAKKYLFKYRREAIWECECDCGNITNVRISKLKNGTTKSCGCFKNKNLINKRFGSDHLNWKGYKQLSLAFFNRIKASAKLRNINFNITIEYLWNLFEKQKGLCVYSGKEIILPTKMKQLRGENNENIASLDRINNEIGYIEGNLQWVCKRINYMKHTMNEDYFLNWIKDIYKYRNTS